MKVHCEVCQVKLRQIMIQMYTCRCKKFYCTTHMNDHNCIVKYKSESPIQVIKRNKVEKI